MKCFDMQEQHSFEDLVKIIEELRRECPWDRAQTLSSLAPCLFDEAKEAVAGARILEETGDGENLCEELGDLMMVILLQARVAEEEGLFTLEDVIDGVSRKMIRRHPHVFGQGYVDENGELVMDWNEIKKREKEERRKDGRKP
jgi:tetrapyrrole methylase family protein/MazG family protein